MRPTMYTLIDKTKHEANKIIKTQNKGQIHSKYGTNKTIPF